MWRHVNTRITRVGAGCEDTLRVIMTRAVCFLAHRREASRGRSNLDDLGREDIRHGENGESSRDMRLVTCELSSLV